MVAFLREEVKEREAYVLNEQVKKCSLDPQSMDEKKTPREDKAGKLIQDKKGFYGQSKEGDPVCYICGKSKEHVISTDGKGNKHVEYVACKNFVEKTPHQRNKLLLKKRFCARCLKPGAIWNSDHECEDTFVCKQSFMKDGVEKQCKKHILVCGHHCESENNKSLLKNYKQLIITPQGHFQDFTKNVAISCFSETFISDTLTDVHENSVFAFQPLDDDDGNIITIFCDNGCDDMIL